MFPDDPIAEYETDRGEIWLFTSEEYAATRRAKLREVGRTSRIVQRAIRVNGQSLPVWLLLLDDEATR